jgi:hypothetical protein
MNRYWTEVVNLNIGTKHDFKISQITIETSAGTLCTYPYADLNFKRPDRTSKLLKNIAKPFQIFRSDSRLVG